MSGNPYKPAAAWGLAVAILVGVGCTRKPDHPSILLVTLDTTRADRIGCYGYDAAATPAIDALAGDGVLFERAYSAAPLTLPSHATLLTGRLPPEHGLRVNGTTVLPAEVPTLVEDFKAAGYDTAAFIAAFVLDSKFGLDRGFDQYDDDMAGAASTVIDLHQYRNGQLVTDRALDWLSSREAKAPFFCWVHLYDPHAPTHAHRDRFGDTYVDRPYDGEIAFVDMQVARLVAWLRETGQYDDAVVAVMGDHGEGLGDHRENRHGYMVYGTTLRVPWIMKLPRQAAAGTRVGAVVSLASAAPTLLDAAGLVGGARLPSPSLAPAWTGGAVPDQACYAETDSPWDEHRWCPLRAITTRDWKYIKTTRPELYHLAEDPGEAVNLHDDQPEQARRMAAALADIVDLLTPVEAATAHLNEEERRVLESLGYLRAAPGTEGGAPPDEELPDMKDMIGLVNDIDRAHELIDGGEDIDAGLALMGRVVQAVPGDRMFAMQYAKALARRQRHEAAIDRYQAILAQWPDTVAATVGLANAYIEHGDTPSARAVLLPAVKAHPGELAIRTGLVAVYLGEGDLEKALHHGREALALGPEDMKVHYNLAVLYERTEQWEDALKHWREVRRIDPWNKVAYDKVEYADAERKHEP